MKPATIISLVVSVLLGAGAILLGRGYITPGASGAAAATVAAPAPVKTQSILVVGEAIKAGTLITPAMLKSAEWPLELVPAGALTSADQLGKTPYALGLMVPGEPVVPEKLDLTGASLTLAASITPGMRAVSVVVENDTGVAGWVLPGDRVDVHEFVPRDEVRAGEMDPDSARTSADQLARPVLKNARVLAVDQTFDANLAGALIANTVTLEVSPEGALAVSVASQRNAIGLSLIGREEEAVVEAIKSDAPKTRGPVYRARPRAEALTTTVRVINGAEAADVATPIAPVKPAIEGLR